MTYIAKINSIAIPFDSHEWKIEPGFIAPIQAWVVPKEIATSILQGLTIGADREVTLTFGDEASPVTVRRVYVVGSAPHDNPQKVNLLLADVRIYLGFAVFIVDVNVRRRLGETRLLGADLVTASLAEDVGYKPWTIKKDKAFRWTDVSDRALAYLAAPKHGRAYFSFVTDAMSLSGIPSQIVEETVTDGEAPVGLARAIESVPGAGLYPDLNGVLHVYDATPGAERTMVEALPKTLWRMGDLQLVDRSGLRPNFWRLYVDYAIEVRFNFPSVSSDDATHLGGLGDLVNVLQVTDRLLDIPAGPWGPARKVGQGTWISLDEAFAAWQGRTVGPFSLPKLSDTIVANHWFGDALQRYAIGGSLTTIDPIWSRRIQELMRRFRTTFRVNSKMWDRVRHWKATRVGVWDPVTGTRAASPVYSNFHYMQLDNFVSEKINVFGLNVLNSYPDGDGKLASGAPSGFELSVDDEELMIFSIVRNTNKFPGHTQIAPSPVQEGMTTTGDDGLNEAVLQKLQPLAASRNPGPGTWQFSTILTCTPASPNDLRRCYEVITPLSEAIDYLGGLTDPPSCKGPDREMRSHLAEARVLWVDDPSSGAPWVNKDIFSAFGRNDDGDIVFLDPVQNLTPLNLETELKPLGRALAAADLVEKLDHYVGKLTVPMSSSIVPIGSVNSITHKVMDNRAVTEIRTGMSPPKYNAMDFLPASARKFILQEIQKNR